MTRAAGCLIMVSVSPYTAGRYRKGYTMTERVTIADADAALRRYCETTGQPYGHYQRGELYGVDGAISTIPGGLEIDYNPTYGGCVIERISDTGDTGVSQPYGARRRSPADTVDFLRAMTYGYSDAARGPGL